MPKGHSCPEGEKYCPDCNDCRPVGEFYAGRTSYCKKHQYARMQAHRAKAPTDSQTRLAQRRADKAYYERHKTNDAYRERRRTILNAYRKRNPEKVAAAYKAWVAAHPDERYETQQAWAERNRDTVRRSKVAWRRRQSLSTRTAAAPTDPALDTIQQELAQRDRDLSEE